MSSPTHPRCSRTPPRGFTLIELLVAMFILSVLSLLGWRAMDTLMRTKEITQTHTQQNALIQVALAQWRADLMAIQPVTGMNDAGVSWDGRVLRLTRRSSALQADGSESGLWVVAWTLRTDSLQQASWTRWQSPPQTQLAALAQAWQQAQNWGHNEINDLPGQTSLIHVNRWQIYYYRNNTWSNSLSSADTTSTQTGMPDAIRLILELSPDSGMSGSVTLDWVRPDFSNNKS